MLPNPRRRDDLHVECLEGELCIYDGTTQQAHVLNRTASWVWERCDGEHGTGPLAAELARETEGLPPAAAEVVVAEALARLREAGLLLGEPRADAAGAGMTRRALLALGVGAALLPVVQTVAVPAAASQVSAPLAARAYVANEGGATVSVIDTATNTVTATVTVGNFPFGVAVNAAGRECT